MNWIEVALVAAAIVGLVAGGVLVARSPSFWVGIGTVMFKAGMPYLIKYVTKRMTPAEETEWRAAERAGRGDEWLRRRRHQRKQ